jgi:hypothetical protein
MGSTPGERRDRARVAAYAKHLKLDPQKSTVKLRLSRELRLERKAVDPKGLLDPDGPEYAKAKEAIEPAELERRIKLVIGGEMAKARLAKAEKRRLAQGGTARRARSA